jgi:hypothetical protein
MAEEDALRELAAIWRRRAADTLGSVEALERMTKIHPEQAQAYAEALQDAIAAAAAISRALSLEREAIQTWRRAVLAALRES